jgi:hypothetical protein
MLPTTTGSGLGGGRRKLVRLDDTLEGGTLVGAIAKRLALGKSTATKADLRAATEAVGVAFLVHNFHFAVNQQRAVVYDSYLNF